MKRVKSRFTLIEMLAVVAIASILVALITPAVQGMLFGNRVDQCASNLKLAMEQAQSKAVAARRYVALILPTDHSASANAMKPYCKSGYRMAYVKKDGNTFVFVEWIPGSEWKNPNDGALLINISNTAPGNSPEEWAENRKQEFADAKPGTKLSNLSDIDLNSVTVQEFTDIGGSTGCALVFSPFGGIANHDMPLYFSVTEARVEGTSYVLNNPDNFLVLKLNAITGRVTYFDPYYKAE